MKIIKRFQVWLIDPDPTVGSEVIKKRPAVVISPDEMNELLHTVIVIPLTSNVKGFPMRIQSYFGTGGELMTDQIRVVDKSRVIKYVGKIPDDEAKELCDVLTVMFQY